MQTNNLIVNLDVFDEMLLGENSLLNKFNYHKTPKERIVETLKRVNKLPFEEVDINFNDDFWDFSNVIEFKTSTNYSFYFDKLNFYKDIAKVFVFDEILKSNSKIRTISCDFMFVRKFLIHLESLGYSIYHSVPKNVFVDYFDDYKKKVKYNTYESNKSKIKYFTNYYEKYINKMNDPSIIKFLKKTNRSKIKSLINANKTPEVPVEYFSIFLDGCKKIMRDEKADKEDRKVAAALIMFSQIGFRTSEFLSLKVDSIKTSYSPEGKDPLYYLDFYTTKSVSGDNGYEIAHTFLNELSYEAYQTLVDLCRRRRDELGIDTLFVTKFQKGNVYSVPSFTGKYNMFLLRNWKTLNNLNINDTYEDLSSFQIRDILKVDKDGRYNFSLDSENLKSLKLDDYISYPTITQFRVSVCTNLARHKVPIKYIKDHMNHLTEDMTDYYVRPAKDLEKDYSETIYTSIYKEGAKLLGNNADVFVEKINDFIEENNLNIHENFEQAIEIISDNFPLRSKVGGMCIRCGEVIPCASNNSTDEIYCAFGMCGNHCHMYFMADISYEEYLKQIKVINYNEEKGHLKACQKETNKLNYFIKNTLLPELENLKVQIDKHGENYVINQHPQLVDIVNDYAEIMKDVETWIK